MTAPLIGPASAPDLHVMSLNVRRPVHGLARRRADRWEARRPRLRELLRVERPTILGVQEALPRQADVIADALGAGCRFVGRGHRAGYRGEGCPLFYDASRLELLSGEQRALSDTPHVAGSRSWGNPIPRIVVSATFRDRSTGAAFFVVNTHLDPFSPRSRVRAADTIRRLIAAQSLPAVVTGDLNARPGSPAVEGLLRDGLLGDSWVAAEERLTPEWGTWANYRTPRPGARIDWIMTSASVAVRRAAIHGTPVGGGWASDHLPVQVLLRMPPKETTS